MAVSGEIPLPDTSNAPIAKLLLTRDEARRIAVNIAKLPPARAAPAWFCSGRQLVLMRKV